jgi:hypothetical protein
MTTFGMPPAYVGAPLVQPSADAGTCILTPTATMIRPKIGGMHVAKQHTKRKTRGSKKSHKKSHKNRRNHRNHRNHKNHRNHSQKAGFVPSIGDPFSVAVGKYVAPVALYGLYKFLNKTKTGRRTKKSR